MLVTLTWDFDCIGNHLFVVHQLAAVSLGLHAKHM
jgi:hypothetical protein